MVTRRSMRCGWRPADVGPRPHDPDSRSGPMARYGDEMTGAFAPAVQRANLEGRVIGRKAKTVRGIATASQKGVTAVGDACARRSVEGTVRPVGAKLGPAPETTRRVA